MLFEGDNFTAIYSETGEEVNPLPRDVKMDVWCADGLVENVTSKELGMDAFIARSYRVAGASPDAKLQPEQSKTGDDPAS